VSVPPLDERRKAGTQQRRLSFYSGGLVEQSLGSANRMGFLMRQVVVDYWVPLTVPYVLNILNDL
jgi:hypothetical protein